MFISAMDMTIVNVALPDMSNDLDAGIGELQWVLDAFLVSLAGLLLVGSGLADRFGRRRVFLSGFVGFAAASVLTAASQTVGEVIAARVLMGVAAACVLPPALSLLAVLPARAAAQGVRGLVGRRWARAGPRTGRRRRAGRRGGLALGVPRQRPVRAAGRSARAALAARVAPARRAPARRPRRGALHSRADRRRVRAHRGRRRGLDEPDGALRRGGGHRCRRRLLRRRAAPSPAAVRRARTGAPARGGGRVRHSRLLYRDARDAVPAPPVRAVRPGRLGARRGLRGRALRTGARCARGGERAARGAV